MTQESNAEETTRMNLAQRLSAIMREVDYVQKTGYNSFQRYNYASETDLILAVRPWMTKFGVIMYPDEIEVQERTTGDTTNAIVWYCLMNIDDMTDCIRVPILASGSDKTDKGAYKLLTGALKYALRQIYLIPLGEDDPEGSDSDGNKTGISDTEHPIVRVKAYANSININLYKDPFLAAFKELKVHIDNMPGDDRGLRITKNLAKALREIKNGTSPDDAAKSFLESSKNN